MSIRKNTFPVPNIIFPRNVLVSVYDKTGLDELVGGLVRINPGVIFYSTGGTGKRIQEILASQPGDRNFVSVENFTSSPEMEGGLVKTLHPKIHAGLLAERGNPEHVRYLTETMTAETGTPGVYFDVLVSNLYPFKEVVSKPGVTLEDARVNIDIGGPAMIRAAAKNWHSVAALTRPDQYLGFIPTVRANLGIPAHQRFNLACAAFDLVASYDAEIASYFFGYNSSQAMHDLNLVKDNAPVAK